jgi:hypothetical protein
MSSKKAPSRIGTTIPIHANTQKPTTRQQTKMTSARHSPDENHQYTQITSHKTRMYNKQNTNNNDDDEMSSLEYSSSDSSKSKTTIIKPSTTICPKTSTNNRKQMTPKL